MLCRVGSSKPTFLAQRWEPRYPQALVLPLFIYVIPYVGRGYASSLTPPPWQPRVSFSLTEARGPLLGFFYVGRDCGSPSLSRSAAQSLLLPETEARGPSLLSRRATLCLPLAFAAVPGGQQTSISPNRLWSAPESPPCGGSGLLSCPRTSSWQSVLRTFFRGRLQSPRSPCQEAGLPLQLIAQGRRLGGLVIRTELP